MVVKKVRVYSESGITKVLYQEKQYESEFLWCKTKTEWLIYSQIIVCYCVFLAQAKEEASDQEGCPSSIGCEETRCQESC